MSTNHNRIKVSDLETNERNKILKTNLKGELEFIDVSTLQTDSAFYSSDTYTPTLNNILNITDTKILNANYTKIGNIINVMVAFFATHKALGQDTEIGISLPFTRGLSTNLLSGIAVGLNAEGVNFSAHVYATDLSTATIKYRLTTRGSSNIVANFSYAIS